MEKVTKTEVNITDIKYDNATNSLLIQRQDEPKWTVKCKNVIRLSEDLDDVAPFLICDYLETYEGYAIFKALKVFTVFVEREGVLHLRKFDNLIKKIKTGRIRDENSLKKVVLLCDKDEETFIEVFNDAGVEIEVVKPTDKPRLDVLKKADVDEIVSLKALDVTSSKDLSDAEDLAKTKEECLVNGEEVVFEKANGIEDGNKVVMNGSAGIEDVVSIVDAKREESVKTKLKSNKNEKEESDAKIENDHSKHQSSPETKEVETIGDAVVKRKKNDVKQKGIPKEGVIESIGDRFVIQKESSWHWSYYLIPAALIAILAISLHLFRDKNRVGNA